MPLELTFLGSGTSAGVPMIGCDCKVCTSTNPKDQRTRPSVLLRIPDPTLTHSTQGQTTWDEATASSQDTDPLNFHARFNPKQVGHRQLLIDTAPDLRDQCVREKLSRVDAVLFTHAHADHIFGLDDLRRFNAVMKQPIEMHAEPDVIASFQRMFKYIFEPHTNLNPSFIPQLLAMPITPDDTLELYGSTVQPLRLMHGRQPVLGFRVEHKNAKLAYCTDVSTIPPETWPQLQGLDVLVLDALRYRHHPTHLTVDRALEIIEELQPKRTFLTHLAHDIAYDELCEQLPDHVRPAYDGLTVTC